MKSSVARPRTKSRLRQLAQRLGRYLVHARPLLATAAVIAPSLWIFDKAQSYVDGLSAQTLPNHFRWLVPLLAALAYAGTAAFVCSLLVLGRQTDRDQDGLPDAIVAHARNLQNDDRHRSVLRLREAMSPLLHAWGFHNHRRALGLIAAESAVSLGDDLQYAAILLDDIGWSQHLLGENDEARTAIQRAIQIASRDVDNASKALLRYKAFRHLSIIEASGKDLQTSNEYIMKAADILINADLAVDMRRLEMAQLDHARAVVTTIHLGLNKSGRLSPTDTAGWQLIQDCMPGLIQAAREFEELGSFSRAVKTLELVARIAEATGDKLAAQEAAIRSQALTKKSLWTERGILEGIKGI